MTGRYRTAVLAVAAIAVVLSVAVTPAAAHTNNVEADAQLSADGTLVVEWEFITVDGYLVVRADDGGEPGEPIGHTPLEGGSGFNTDATVAIDDTEWDAQSGSRDLWVTLHREAAGQGFDPEEDPVLRTFGEPARSQLTVEGADASARLTAQGFSPQETTNGTVSVRHVELPEDGYVVAHTVSGTIPSNVPANETGDIVGTTQVSAGTHGNVTVELDENFVNSSGDRAVLKTVLYRGSGPFDPETAEMMTAGDTPIGSALTVDFVSTDETTPTATVSESDIITTATPDAMTPTATATSSDTADDGTGVGIVSAVLAVLMTAVLRRRSH
jgi:hypothetical protein